ncbi:MAG: hypothetical protein ACOYNI_09860 [Acidimicrobiia bacterium]
MDTPVVVALWIALASAIVSFTANIGSIMLSGVTKFVVLQLAVAFAIAWTAVSVLRSHRRTV